MTWEDFLKACCIATVCIFLNCSSSPAAEMKTFTCSGELWNIRTDPAGPTWLEIGHGIHQCSIRDASSENARKILSVCNLNADCAMKADVDAQRLRKSAAEGECDDLCIFEGDKIVWVKKGNAAADSKVHIGDLPYEAQQEAKQDLAACKESGDDAVNSDLDSTIDVYEMGNGKRLAIFDPKRICAAHGVGACSTDGCDVSVYSEKSPGFWTVALKQTIMGDFTVDAGTGSKPLRLTISLRGGVPPCKQDRGSACNFELIWRGAGFA
jgi:hypothetical protein